MNEDHSEMYHVSSGYYDLQIKKPWVCGKSLYLVLTTASAVVIGLAVACFFAPWLFGITSMIMASITLIGIYYTMFAIFAPLVLFCACIHGCSKFNRKLFNDRENNLFKATDIFYAIHAICLTFLKATLFYYLIAIFLSPVVLIIAVIVATHSVFKVVGGR